jgi:hypothetical protein
MNTNGVLRLLTSNPFESLPFSMWCDRAGKATAQDQPMNTKVMTTKTGSSTTAAQAR